MIRRLRPSEWELLRDARLRALTDKATGRRDVLRADLVEIEYALDLRATSK